MSDGNKLLELVRSVLDKGGMVCLWAAEPGGECRCVVYQPKTEPTPPDTTRAKG
jgi:hypothetical protein